MTDKVQIEALESIMSLREICQQVVVRLRESAGDDAAKHATIDTIKMLFDTQNQIIADLMETQMLTCDFIEEAKTLLAE